MSDWNHKGKVRDLLQGLEAGVSVNGYNKAPLPNEKSVLKVSSVTYGRFKADAAKPIKKNDLARAKCTPKKNQIIISRSNTPELVGASAFVPSNYPNRYLSDKLWQTVPRNNINLSTKWLSYVLSSPVIRYRLSRLATGSSNSMKNITKEELLSLTISIPPYKEQEIIAHTLDYWDTAIEKIEALIDAKQKQFDWLQRRLLDKNIKEYQGKLESYVKISKYNKINTANGYKPLTVKLHCKGIEANERDIQIVISKKGRPYFQRSAGDFLIGRQNFHNGGFGIVPADLDGFIASNAITTLDIDQLKLDRKYLFYLFSRKDYYLRIGHIMDGTGQKELSDKQILKLPVSIPELDEQKKVVASLDTAQQEIDQLKKLAELYRTQKRGLMQKLLSGEWRIQDNNKEAA